MYTIVIADDEATERAGLRKLIHTYFHDLNIIGEATNGRDAVDICKGLKPDVLIIDIKMPLLNGIEASRRIKEFSSDTHVIISSAYSDFEYMNKAIVIGMDDYLLKPYSIEQLHHTINNTIEKIVNARKIQMHNRLRNKKLEDALPIVESQFTQLVINGNIYKDELREYFEIMDKDFSNGIIFLFRIRQKRTDMQDTDTKHEVKLKQIFRYLYMKMHKEFNCALSIISSNTIVLIISLLDVRQVYKTKTCAAILSEQVCSNIEQLYKEKLETGISTIYKGEHGIVHAYREASEALELAHSKETENPGLGYIVDGHEGSNGYPFQDEEHLLLSIKSGDAEMCSAYLDSIFSYFVCADSNDVNLIDTVIYINALVAEIQKLIISKINFTKEFKIFHLDAASRVISFADVQELRRELKEAVTEVIDIFKDNHRDKNRRIISQVEKYILNHYYTEITLEDMAESVLLSPQYFSKIFKEQAGMSFIKYLTKVRMKEANILLENSNLKISEISQKVGYNNPDYFLRVYKKFYGVTPSRYRETVQ